MLSVPVFHLLWKLIRSWTEGWEGFAETVKKMDDNGSYGEGIESSSECDFCWKLGQFKMFLIIMDVLIWL